MTKYLPFERSGYFIILFTLTVFLFVNVNIAYTQEVSISRTEETIEIDGILSEQVWQNANLLTGFTQMEPDYGTTSSQKTIVKVIYDDRMIYFGIKCFDTDISRISTKITRRDGGVAEDDAVGIFLDTFNDGNNAYLFVTNARGTQEDTRIADNGRTQDNQWDVTWYSAGSINEDGWNVEIGIPFTVIKFDKKANVWGINIGRSIPRNLETSFWIPEMTDDSRVSEFGKLTNLDLENVITKKYTLIPYVQSQLEKGEKPSGDVGLDARYSLSTNMGLDATFNPDFATIEADAERINLTRFELSFPEKRPFFLEGAENYSTRIRQFYSRRIGEIPWGAKINGKSEVWKFNMLTTQSDPSTSDPDLTSGKDAYYTVFRLGRELNKSSNIGLIGANRNYADINKGSLGLSSTLFFTKVIGMTSQVIRSYGEYGKGAWTYFFRPAYDSQTTHFHVRYSHTGEHVRENMNDIGFISDDDRREFDTNIRKTFWINRYGIEYIRPSINYNRYYSQKGTLRSWDDSNELEIKFLKNWEFILEHEEEFKKYEKDFRNRMVDVELNYDTHQGTYLELGYGKGKNYDRDIEQIHAEVSLNPLEGLNIDYDLTKVWFYPADVDDNTLIHYIRTSYYLNNDLFLKLFYQSRYNIAGEYFDTQFDLDRETVQLVFVWRFLPPFGSLQLAYQQGTTRVSDISGKDKTLFSKISWVF